MKLVELCTQKKDQCTEKNSKQHETSKKLKVSRVYNKRRQEVSWRMWLASICYGIVWQWKRNTDMSKTFW